MAFGDVLFRQRRKTVRTLYHYITPSDRAAAVNIGDQNKHVMFITGAGGRN
jgi:hypothetical protein